MCAAHGLLSRDLMDIYMRHRFFLCVTMITQEIVTNKFILVCGPIVNIPKMLATHRLNRVTSIKFGSKTCTRTQSAAKTTRNFATKTAKKALLMDANGISTHLSERISR